MKKLILLAILASCGNKVATVDFGGDGLREGMALSNCSTVGDAIKCEGNVSIPTPPAFPFECGGCLTTTKKAIDGSLLASVKCPGKSRFEFSVPKAERGEKGDRGTDGDVLTLEGNLVVTRTSAGVFKWSKEIKDGKNGVGAVIERQGDFLITYKIDANGVKSETDRVNVRGATGPVGPQGERGLPGASCTFGEDNLKRITMTCGSVTKVISSCNGGSNCYAFGARANLYEIPYGATDLIPEALLPSPSAVNRVNDFSIFNRQSSLGIWGTTTSLTAVPWARQTYYQATYEGLVELPPSVIHPVTKKVRFRTTTDDSSLLSIGQGACTIRVVSTPGLNAPVSREGELLVTASGSFHYTLSYAQLPATQIALAWQVWDYDLNDWRLIRHDELTYVVQ